MSTAAARHLYALQPRLLHIDAYVFERHNNVRVTVADGHGLDLGFTLPAAEAEQLGQHLIELAAQARANDHARRAAEAPQALCA